MPACALRPRAFHPVSCLVCACGYNPMSERKTLLARAKVGPVHPGTHCPLELSASCALWFAQRRVEGLSLPFTGLRLRTGLARASALSGTSESWATVT